MTLLALFIGLLILAQGILGLAAPELFVSVIRFFTTPPVVYLGAVIRVLFGIVLIRAASVSRARWGLRILGFIILIGGLLTPFFGVRAANAILSLWSAGGPGLVRIWAGVSLALGIFVIYAVLPNRPTS